MRARDIDATGSTSAATDQCETIQIQGHVVGLNADPVFPARAVDIPCEIVRAGLGNDEAVAGVAGIVVLATSTVIRCNASRNIPSGNGIQAGAGCTIADCTAGDNGNNGISVDLGSTVRNCTTRANAQTGIIASSRCQLTGNTSDSNQFGMDVTGDSNHVDGNSCTIDPARNATAFYYGFFIRGNNNWVVRNTARGALTNVDWGFVFVDQATNAVGPIERTNGGTISTNSPWANFRHFNGR